jgi:predicted Ser/Thr protein kinase
MERTALPEGTELGGYTLGPVLGSGGMGTVYRAVDADGVNVAVKLLHPALAADSAARQRLRREVAVLQRLRGRGIARVVDAEVDGPEAFVVTEYIDGQTLTQTVAADGPFEPAELAAFAADLAATLAEVHRAGVVHRDLKPGNIMIGPDGPVLIDFGIAQEGEATRLTGTGFLIGTPGFVAPELIAGGEPTYASDHWGLAAALAFAATGRVPFGEGRFDIVFTRVAAGEPDLAGLPAAIAGPLAAALRPDPTDRLPASSLAAALREAADGGPLTGPTRRFGESGYADDDGPGTEWVSEPPAWSPRSVPGAVPGGQRPAEAGSSHATDWIGEPLVDGPEPPIWVDGPEAPSPWAVREPAPRRRVLALALWLGLSGLATVRPVVGAVIVGVILLTGRTWTMAAETLRLRRLRRGESRRRDTVRTAAATPVYAVRSAVGLVPGLAVGAILGALTWLMARYGVRADLPGTLALGLGVAVAGIGTWFGPDGDATRYGTLKLLGWVAWSRGAALVVAFAALAWTGLVVAGWAMGGPEGALARLF